MKTAQQLQSTLHHLDGKSYKAYREIRGQYAFEGFDLSIDHVQGDPFAAPSRVRVRIRNTFPDWAQANKSRRTALCDYLNRQFSRACRRFSKGNRGSGKSGAVFIAQPGQEILERTSVVLRDDWMEARFRVGLPAFGRRIAGRQAAAIFEQEIPQIVAHSLPFEVQDEAILREHIFTNEDADALRVRLPELGLVAFVADGAILPRASGVDDRPMPGGLPFQSPDSLQVEVELPNRTISGMGIPEGITLIVGGGFHGKSTLLRAIELGVYNHIPGDGRSFVVSQPGAAKIRAEDGRYIERVDISPFINNLPGGQPTQQFSTPNASGSTSQAANVMEALEAGATALLIDEDTSATNFMIRDQRMQALIPQQREPITPFVDRIRQLYEEQGVSTVLVLGGSGLYLDAADTVIGMNAYRSENLTARARSVAQEFPQPRSVETPAAFPTQSRRIPLPESLNAQKGKRVKVQAFDIRSIQFGEHDIDLSAVAQVVENGQLNAVADALLYLRRYLGEATLPEALNRVMQDIEQQGLGVLQKEPNGDYAAFRSLELAAALNRLRGLRVNPREAP
ncbi:ABC-ATPase domain-containing protein [Phaeodactylibacter xiamenensis]|uniref:ABC-ATPase domain-containing protein n=1 Tax=Phaeodactylibacter xiamenensis TaxID=1524460 RepID=UPI003CCC21DA